MTMILAQRVMILFVTLRDVIDYQYLARLGEADEQYRVICHKEPGAIEELIDVPILNGGL